MEADLCPVCERGQLAPAVRDMRFAHEGREVLATGLEFSKCEACGEGVVTPAQARRNQSKIADAKREAAGLLTGSKVREVREFLGLSQPQAALLFGGGENAFSKYERGDVIQSVPMDRLLKAALRYPRILDMLWMEADGENDQISVEPTTWAYGDAVPGRVGTLTVEANVLPAIGDFKVVVRERWKKNAA